MGDQSAFSTARFRPRARRPRSATRPRSGCCRDGQGTAEFAASALVFVALLFGTIDVGRALYAYHFVDYAARAATRYAIVRGSASPSPARASDIQTYVSNLKFGLASNSSCSGSSSTPKALCVTTTWTPNNSKGSNVQVKVQYNFQPVAPFLSSTTLLLASTAQMVIAQ